MSWPMRRNALEFHRRDRCGGKCVLAIARQGLKRRARLGASLTDERGYLAELEEIADSGVTPAERWLEHYNAPWRGQVSPVFEAAAY